MTLKAVVRNGRLVLDEATDLPDGTEVVLAIVDDGQRPPELLKHPAASAADLAAGDVVDFEAAITNLGSKV